MPKDKKTHDVTSGEKPEKTEKKIEPAISDGQKKEVKDDYLMTGLSDYGFWCEQVKKERGKRKQTDPPFRRGRIWC